MTHSSPRTPLAGFSLMEVIISLGIFFALMAGIMQALISTRNFVGEDEIRNDQDLEALRIMREFAGDIGNSAWFLNPPSTNTNPNSPEPRLLTPTTYPNVGKGPAAVNRGTTDWGDQLDFVKLRLKNSTWLSPHEMRSDPVEKAKINLTQNAAAGMNEIFEAPTLASLIANPDWRPGDDDSVAFVWPVFEAAVAPLTFQENFSFSTPGRSPRLYRYIVRAQPGTRNGRLVRQYSNGPGTNYAAIMELATQISSIGEVINPPPVVAGPNPWVDDIILTDQVKATNDPDYPELIGTPGIRFDTFLTDSSVTINEVRVRVILVRQGGVQTGGTRMIRTMQTAFAMRSVTFF
jgi:type II secretory pathway pseudopilin PulG